MCVPSPLPGNDPVDETSTLSLLPCKGARDTFQNWLTNSYTSASNGAIAAHAKQGTCRPCACPLPLPKPATNFSHRRHEFPSLLFQPQMWTAPRWHWKIDFPSPAAYNWQRKIEWQRTGGVPTRADGRETPSWLKGVSVLAAHIRGSGSLAGSRSLTGKVAGKAGSVKRHST